MPSDLQHHAVGLLQRHAEGLVVDVLELVDEREQPLADAVLLAPAAERGDHVLGGDGRAVVELELVAQREGVDELVLGDVDLVDHLRLGLHVGVVAEQRVVDQHAVDVGDGLRRPDRVEDAHVGMQHGAQHLLLGLGESARRDRCGERAPQARCRPSAMTSASTSSWPSSGNTGSDPVCKGASPRTIRERQARVAPVLSSGGFRRSAPARFSRRAARSGVAPAYRRSCDSRGRAAHRCRRR